MANRTVYVSRKGQSTNIKLRDSEGHNPGNDQITTDVNPGDTITWALDSNSNLDALEGVAKKSSSAADLLTGPPVRQSNGSYVGTVKSSGVADGAIEEYNITYSISGISYTDDPKMKMVLGSSGTGG